ncbi:FAD-binding domain-containing protein [Hypomontagnella monticulosa]|nr:FAD-binding domain-containing protein [Hypomontagnella monticulosa]
MEPTDNRPNIDSMPLVNIKDVPWPAGVQVHYPGSDAFENATIRWSIYEAPQYTAVVSPSSEEELAKIVKTAREFNIPILATAGRHAYGITLGTFHGGLAIDLSNMNTVKVDEGAGTVVIGAGAKLDDMTGPVEKAGYMMPMGTCPSAGTIGVTIGGGVGFFQGLFGLMIDSLLSARLITAKGDTIDVSEKDNPDLFWAIRGAGANFGIITMAIYKLHKAPNHGQISMTDAIYPANTKSAFFDVLESFQDIIPAELAVCSVILWDNDSSTTQILVSFVYFGPETEAHRVIAPFLNLKPPVLRTNSVPYSQFHRTIFFGSEAQICVPGRISDVFSVNVRKVSAETLKSTFDKLDAFLKANPDGRESHAILETFPNQAVISVPDEATAYPWRDSKGNFFLNMSWPDLGNPVEEVANALGYELRQDIAKASGYPELTVYLNYARGDETPEQKHGKDKLHKLVRLKKAWDPTNVFRYSNSLPMEHP